MTKVRTLLSNWYPMRWAMLILGLVLGYNYMVHGSAVSGMLSLIILFQSVTNTGCVLGQCKPEIPNKDQMDMELDAENVIYEEIKTSN